MTLSQVKLIVSDLDGTLLNSNHQVSDEFFELFKVLKSKNILFVAASGRPYYSMIDKLSSIKDDIIIVSENGGLAIKQDDLLISNTFKKDSLDTIAKLVIDLEAAHPVFCTKNKAYVISKSQKLMSLLSEYYSNYQVIDNVSEIKEDVVGPGPAPSPCNTVFPTGLDSTITALSTLSILAIYELFLIKAGCTR